MKEADDNVLYNNQPIDYPTYKCKYVLYWCVVNTSCLNSQPPPFNSTYHAVVLWSFSECKKTFFPLPQQHSPIITSLYPRHGYLYMMKFQSTSVYSKNTA